MYSKYVLISNISNFVNKTFRFQKPRGRGAGSASNSNNNNSSTSLNNKNDNSSSAITKMDTSPIPGNRNINVSKFL